MGEYYQALRKKLNIPSDDENTITDGVAVSEDEFIDVEYVTPERDLILANNNNQETESIVIFEDEIRSPVDTENGSESTVDTEQGSESSVDTEQEAESSSDEDEFIDVEYISPERDLILENNDLNTKTMFPGIQNLNEDEFIDVEYVSPEREIRFSNNDLNNESIFSSDQNSSEDEFVDVEYVTPERDLIIKPDLAVVLPTAQESVTANEPISPVSLLSDLEDSECYWDLAISDPPIEENKSTSDSESDAGRIIPYYGTSEAVVSRAREFIRDMIPGAKNLRRARTISTSDEEDET